MIATCAPAKLLDELLLKAGCELEADLVRTAD